MKKYLFLEYNKPGMEWLKKTENPIISIIEAETPEQALTTWTGYHSRYLTEDHLEGLVINEDEDIPDIRDAYGSDVQMFEIAQDLTHIPWEWARKLVFQATFPEISETKD